VRVRGGSAEARREASRRFVAPLREHLGQAGLGHVSEVADGDPSHRPGGCPFQAWSLAELLRLELCVLAEGQAPARGTLSLSAREGGAASAQPEGRT
jgi:glycogen debranching enzyme